MCRSGIRAENSLSLAQTAHTHTQRERERETSGCKRHPIMKPESLPHVLHFLDAMCRLVLTYTDGGGGGGFFVPTSPLKMGQKGGTCKTELGLRAILAHSLAHIVSICFRILRNVTPLLDVLKLKTPTWCKIVQCTECKAECTT